MKVQQQRAVSALLLGLGVMTFSAFSISTASAAGSKGGSSGGGKQGNGSKPPAPPKTGGGSASDIPLIQAALGITLTDAQKTAITTAATTRDAAVKAALDAYKAQVAAIFGLTAAGLDAQIQTYLSNHKGAPQDFNSLLSGALGITLTDAQKSALLAAATSRDAAIMVAVDAYRTSVAAAVGLSVTDLDAKIQAYLKAHPQGGGGCPPGGGGSNSGSGSSSGSGSGSGSTGTTY